MTSASVDLTLMLPRTSDRLRTAHAILAKAIAFAPPPPLPITPGPEDFEAQRNHWVEIGAAVLDYAHAYCDELSAHSRDVSDDFPNQLIDTLDTIFAQLERATDRAARVDWLTGERV